MSKFSYEGDDQPEIIEASVEDDAVYEDEDGQGTQETGDE